MRYVIIRPTEFVLHLNPRVVLVVDYTYSTHAAAMQAVPTVNRRVDIGYFGIVLQSVQG